MFIFNRIDMANYDFIMLKKKYGEKFAKMCRMLFPDFLETEGLLYETITNNFAESKVLYDDIKNHNLTLDFKNFIYSFLDEKIYNKTPKKVKNPYELMKQAGYTLYRCETHEEVMKFSKYWRKDEMLCTFRDPYRTEDCFVFFAVKNGAEKLKRENFVSPKRQDEYGTSVIGIQISKDQPNTISILNRYNHTVKNPDSTFSNNLDNIIEGLTQSFINMFYLVLSKDKQELDWSNYVKAKDGKFYRYNFERSHYRFCPDNIVIDPEGKVVKFNKDRYELFDYFVLDKKNNTIEKFLELTPESFELTINNIAKTQVKKVGDDREIVITNTNGEDIVITLNKYNRIIKYHNPVVERIYDFFLNSSSVIEELNLPNVKKIDTNFITSSKSLKHFSLPNVVEIGDNALMFNETVSEIYLPKLEKVGKYFLRQNENVEELDLPSLKHAGSQFMIANKKIKKLNAPNLERTGIGFLHENLALKEIDLPSLTTVDGHFITRNKNISCVNLPKLTTAGESFLRFNENLRKLSLPNLTKVGPYFLSFNKALKQLHAPKLKETGYGFLENNEKIDKDIYDESNIKYKRIR